ncbi:glycosyltransferase [Pedobacter aquatilis]|uniref:glycosyltransferase n=1 Tax=Pedobacter aquatilis TaxID=351343 RepID=UPI0029313071|nr:glycosyltransferase [Pedobacter aquatilis]
MTKPVLFYFVHAHGNGHKATFAILLPELSKYFQVIALTTNAEVSYDLRRKHEVLVLELPAKYPDGYEIPEHTFSKAFEVTPYAIEPALRGKAVAEMIVKYRPKAFYCDGVPEIAILFRAMGIPVVLVHLHGQFLNDPTRVFAYELADHIVAHFPVFIEQSDYPYLAKTYYSGYLSKYHNLHTQHISTEHIDNIAILMGYDNYDEVLLKNITCAENIQFTIIGNKKTYNLGENCIQLGMVDDISACIKGNVVISAAGQNTIAELFSLGKRLILLPEPRPYHEQYVHASILKEKGFALLAHEDFSCNEWKKIIKKISAFPVDSSKLISYPSAQNVALQMKKWYAGL